MSSRDSPARTPLNPYEEALQALCKKILKSRLFRGFYVERRYVETVHGYRDIVALHRSERELEKLLLDIRQKLLLFHQQTPNLWVGITTGQIVTAPTPSGAMETHIWLELSGLAYGQYWFSIKGVRFREHEIILKLKMVRPVESEAHETSLGRKRLNSNSSVSSFTGSLAPLRSQRKDSDATVPSRRSDDLTPHAPQIGLQDFVTLLQLWGTSIKQTVYDFMSNDVSKQNILAVLKFLGLLIVSILTGGMYALKMLGFFTLRFIFEMSRLTHVLTPIILKIIDVLNKIVGGFYILLAMVWKDTVVNRGQPKPVHNAVEYNRPLYKSIEYNVRQQQLHSKGSESSMRFPEMERKFQ